MDRKLLICLDVPSISLSCEAMVPAGLRVRELTPLLVRIATDLSDGMYVSSGHEFLCSKDPDCLLDEDAALEDYDIGNGDHLVLL